VVVRPTSTDQQGQNTDYINFSIHKRTWQSRVAQWTRSLRSQFQFPVGSIPHIIERTNCLEYKKCTICHFLGNLLIEKGEQARSDPAADESMMVEEENQPTVQKEIVFSELGTLALRSEVSFVLLAMILFKKFFTFLEVFRSA
jgi:hypothetical protein